jgi:hypothetical protein
LRHESTQFIPKNFAFFLLPQLGYFFSRYLRLTAFRFNQLTSSQSLVAAFSVISYFRASSSIALDGDRMGRRRSGKFDENLWQNEAVG